MAGYTPVSEVHLPMQNDDSGYFSCPPHSVGSLYSEPSSNEKLSHGYKYRNCITSTPHTLQFNTPEVYCRGSRRSLSHKRKASSGRFNLLRRSASVSSSVQLNRSSCTNSDLHSKGELSLDNDFVGLSLLDSSFDLQENDKLDDSAVWCDETDVNENESGKTKDNKEVDNIEQKSDKNEHVNCCQTYMPTVQETGIQDGKIDSHETVSLYHLHPSVLPIEDHNLITNKLAKLTRKSFSQDLLNRSQTSGDFIPSSMPFCQNYSSQELPCSNGQEKVDFISLLGEKNDYSIIVKGILSYLEPVDLTAVALVSKTWNRICTSDTDASRRIHCYVEHKRINKENAGSLQVNKLVSTPAHNRPRIHLRQIQNMGNEGGSQAAVCNPPSPPPSPSKRRFLQFYKAGQQLQNGKTLAPCPRCSLPSQIDGVSNVGQCTHKTCQYLFCCICHCESHNGSSCPYLMPFPRFKKRSSSMCSKESKKNLRRL